MRVLVVLAPCNSFVHLHGSNAGKSGSILNEGTQTLDMNAESEALISADSLYTCQQVRPGHDHLGKTLSCDSDVRSLTLQCVPQVTFIAVADIAVAGT